MNTYGEAMKWIHSRLKFGINLGLDCMEWMMERLGNPESRLKVIHVGGTNGKGSTVTFFRSILHEAGYEVGTFTSPYIEQFNERISVNGVPVSDGDIISLANTIKPLVEELELTGLGSPTEFEVITAMALYYFAELHPVDLVILEVGLGGRFDSTNIVHPLLTVITNIGMDHTRILGGTIEKIAYEKAGIIKAGVPVLTAVKQDQAIRVLIEEAKEKGAPIFQSGIDFSVEQYEPRPAGECFTFIGKAMKLDQLELSLLGYHQTENASLAVAGLLYLKEANMISLKEQHIRTGLAKAYWPGRMETISNVPAVIVDGAHNPEGLQAFSATIKQRCKGKKVTVVFAALEDKDLGSMLPLLEGLGEDIYFTEFDFPRAASAARLKEVSGIKGAKAETDWRLLLKKILRSMDTNEVLAVTGSLYFISQVKPVIKQLLHKKNEHRNQ
ncbi:bifunctional folylpolyglutamate synthase/dihydrofolate synthase [Siminovitchia sp. 179-K 8D1 HS]|uniref:bifunctional folylpolyglutamate synthase/dihydrofolate synthase n=1 Tax=Siminovitchia sp. 179-K 8D1 HS TaxID=3142385 RepID=UPI0039A2A099